MEEYTFPETKTPPQSTCPASPASHLEVEVGVGVEVEEEVEEEVGVEVEVPLTFF